MAAIGKNIQILEAFVIPLLLALVVENLDNVIHWINLYQLDSAIVCPNTYLLDNELSGG